MHSSIYVLSKNGQKKKSIFFKVSQRNDPLIYLKRKFSERSSHFRISRKPNRSLNDVLKSSSCTEKDVRTTEKLSRKLKIAFQEGNPFGINFSSIVRSNFIYYYISSDSSFIGILFDYSMYILMKFEITNLTIHYAIIITP